MKRQVISLTAVLAFVAGVAIPSATSASTVPQRLAGIHRLSAEQLDSVKFTPRSQQEGRLVRALVELTADPVAVAEQNAAPNTQFDRRAASDQVRAQQDAETPALQAAGADVVGHLTTVANAVQVTVNSNDLAALAAVPGVKSVQVSRLIHLDNAAAAAFTGVPDAWEAYGFTGTGQKIAIIDTGIDYTHADFGGPGTPAAFTTNNGKIIETGSFPTAKVIGGWDFVGDTYDANIATSVPAPDPDPIGCNDHGTHVAGTAAGQGVLVDGSTFTGPYNGSTLTNNSFKVAPGMAPTASLLAYKVFGCNGSVSSDIVVSAIDRAVAEGATVINMSLGSDFGAADAIDAVAVDNATAAGVMVVMSAGNAGAGAYIVGSPSTADTGLSVAAVDASRPTFPGASITGAITLSGQNSNAADLTTTITAPTVYQGLGCAAMDRAVVAGKIVVVRRGTCGRVEKALNIQAAGGLAAVMINNSPGLPVFEDVVPGLTIPFIGIAQADGTALRAAVPGVITIGAGPDVTNLTYTQEAAFTSNGPRRGDNVQKPEISAPGVSIKSAGLGSGTDAITISGTSMASPHTAGIAALTREAHPTWGPRQIKAAIVSTGDPSKIAGFDSRRGGSGLVQPRKSVDTVAFASTADGRQTVTFGFNEIRETLQSSRSYQITNTSDQSLTYDLSAELTSDPLGSRIRFSPRSVVVQAGSTRTVTVAISLSKSATAALPAAEASNQGDLASVNGNFLATPRQTGVGVYALRTPFVMVPSGLSNITSDGGEVQGVGATASGSLELHNEGVHAGNADVYQWAISDPAGDTVDPDIADITSVGVQALPGDVVGAPGDQFVTFAVNQAGVTSTQSIHEIDIPVDVNGDGAPDSIVVGVDGGLALTGSPDGSFLALTVNAKTGALVDGWLADAPANSSVVLLPALASELGASPTSGPMTFLAVGFSVVEDSPRAGDDTATGSFDAWNPALSQGDFVTLAPRQKSTVALSATLAQVTAQAPKGWMVVSFDDAAGSNEADLVSLRLDR